MSHFLFLRVLPIHSNPFVVCLCDFSCDHDARVLSRPCGCCQWHGSHWWRPHALLGRRTSGFLAKSKGNWNWNWTLFAEKDEEKNEEKQEEKRKQRKLRHDLLVLVVLVVFLSGSWGQPGEWHSKDASGDTLLTTRFWRRSSRLASGLGSLGVQDCGGRSHCLHRCSLVWRWTSRHIGQASNWAICISLYRRLHQSYLGPWTLISCRKVEWPSRAGSLQRWVVDSRLPVSWHFVTV